MEAERRVGGIRVLCLRMLDTLSRGTGAKIACRRLRCGKELRARHGALSRAVRVYAGSKDAGSLRGGGQVAAGCLVPVGEEMGCKDVPRQWSKAPGEVFSTGNALCKRREAAEWSAAFGEKDHGARSTHWGEQGLWDT